MPVYSEEEAETVKRMWGEGYSASQIASVLVGRTRNSVIGFLHRLGDEKKPRLNKRTAPTVRNPRKRDAMPRPRKFRHAAEAVHQHVRIERAKVEEPVALMLPLDALTARQCSYACNEAASWQQHLFCGAPTPEGSLWCEHHKALVYVPAIPKTRRKRADILFQAGL